MISPFEVFVIALHWTAMVLVLAIVVLTLRASRSIGSIVTAAFWTAVLVIFLWYQIPRLTNEGNQVGLYGFYIIIAISYIRRLLNFTTEEQAYEQNVSLVRRVFGARIADILLASLNRTRDRKKIARESALTLVDILEIEHKARR